MIRSPMRWTWRASSPTKIPHAMRGAKRLCNLTAHADDADHPAGGKRRATESHPHAQPDRGGDGGNGETEAGVCGLSESRTVQVPELLTTIVDPATRLRMVSTHIWSAIDGSTGRAVYDNHARIYDALIGNALYNRFAWGTTPSDYRQFAERAIRSGDGCLLDAGCGSLVSTAQLHAVSGRPTILCDLSAGMLIAARDRLIALAGSMPPHLMLLQCDVQRLPFVAQSVGSILCPGMLHIFEDIETVTREFGRVAKSDAQIWMSGLVNDRLISRYYLKLLHGAGEVAAPQNSTSLLARLNHPASGLETPVKSMTIGSMLFASAPPAP